jgi:hypothetical protein
MKDTRENWEILAKESVCSCWYYDLCNDIDSLSDDELKKIIITPFYCHIQDYLANHGMVSVDEFLRGLQECSDYETQDVIYNAI